MPDQGQGQERITDGVASMAELVMSEQTLASVLELVLNIVVNAVEGAEAAGIALKRSGRLVTVARTSQVVDQLDGAKEQGPTVHAFSSGEVVRVDDVRADERWPVFVGKAVEHGIAGTLAIPLAPVDGPIGVLTIHASAAGAFDPESERMAGALAKQAAITIANVGSFTDSEQTNEQLRDALQSRDLIGQAKGIIMERDGIGADEAFDQMRESSQTTNRKLRDIAIEIVQRVIDKGKTS